MESGVAGSAVHVFAKAVGLFKTSRVRINPTWLFNCSSLIYSPEEVLPTQQEAQKALSWFQGTLCWVSRAKANSTIFEGSPCLATNPNLKTPTLD